MTVVEDSRFPTGTIEVPVPETQRRQSHIDLIDPTHPLLQVALNHLKDRDRERPSCHEACGHISTLKASSKYIESMQHSPVNTNPTQSANRESRERETQQSQQIQDLQQQLHTQRDQLREKEQENQQLRQQILGLQTLVITKDELHQQLRQRGERRKEGEASGAPASGSSLMLRWRDGGRAPCRMYGEVPAVNWSVAYFQPKGAVGRVFAYTSATNKWSELPECPNSYVSLGMVNNLLTAIGGKTSKYEVTNSLLSLTDNKWTEQFPSMPTKRWLTAVVCSGRSLVVAGGVGERYKYLSTVEVMDTKTLQWFTASSLPHPLFEASATLCGDQIYLLGGLDQRSKQSKSVFTCSLAALLQSCQPQSLGGQLKTLSLASGPKMWHQLADTPVTLSTCASLHGQLLAVGGYDSDDKQTTAVHMYNTTTNSWEAISHMTTPQYQCSVVVLPHNELMVVGGWTPDGDTNSVEIACLI